MTEMPIAQPHRPRSSRLAPRTRVLPVSRLTLDHGSVPATAASGSRSWSSYAAAALPFASRFALVLIAVMLIVFSSSRQQIHATGFNNDYRLGAMDQVRLKVFEWRAAKDEVFEWAALNAEYAIGQSGRISLPLIGEVAASGLSVNELAKSIGQRLQTRMGLSEAPDIAVEVSKFRPFYLIGAVEKPGEYAYRPGMTVLQALAIAGGVTKVLGGARIEREMIQTRGDIVLYTGEFNALLARRARLQAEVGGQDAPIFPVALTNRSDVDDQVATLIRQEAGIFKSRRDLFENQVATLEQLVQYEQEQAKLLEGQIVTHDQQTMLVQQELDGVASLVKKGYSTQTRKNGLERNAAQLRGDRLRLQDQLLRVNGELSRTNIALLDLHNKRVTDATVELREIQSKLEAIAHRSDTAERLLYETEAAAPMLIAERSGTKREPIYTIVRVDAGSEISATETTQIEPGDTVKVELPRARSGLSPTLATFDQSPERSRLDPSIEAAVPVSRRVPHRETSSQLVPSSAPLQ